ncbi:hypothetical protein K469DRAFT_653648 [Zopfia rhizophila CBS 207.26]|uniref:Heterokaryon incompatibility domain-containing protein n=1 Tax=Zopfia rhizophila CBS 207.26 TaxID=1314779 RepID=A0A6A6EJJ3_9PEZI|nr:hypothetical protein K469DRAFT_653648 [Zopfia rhizophila CBS 207.26]
MAQSGTAFVWGIEAAGTDFITCRSSTLGVTSTCHSALRQLRKKLGQFTIWIDAIYISQESEDEKMNQILLVGGIYSKAKIVYIWLGEGNAATNRATAYLETARYLKYSLSNSRPTEDELRKPRFWAATWSGFTARLSLARNLFPSFKHGSNRLLRYFDHLTIAKFPGVACVS